VLAALVAVGPRPARAVDPDKSLAQCTKETWRVRDGLPGGWVRAIGQSEDGYLWIGAQGGLARYDGVQIVSLASEPALRRASDVVGILRGRQGELWVLPAYGPPICIRAGAPFACLPPTPLLPENIRLEAALIEPDGGVWLASRHELLHHARGRTRLVARFAALGWRRLEALARDGSGRLWLGTDRGLFVLDGDVPRAAEPAGLPAAPVDVVTRDASGTVWAAGAGRLFRIAAGQAPVIVAGAEPWLTGTVGALLADAGGSLWIGTREGLVRHRQGRFVRYGPADGLPDPEVTSLFEDREGSLWVGMRLGGLAQFTDRTLDTQQGPPELRGKRIETVAEAAAGEDAGALWVGTADGLWRWKDGVTRRYGKADGLVSARVLSVLPTPEGTLWVGTDRGLHPMRAGQVEAPLFTGTPVFSLARIGAGRVWVGGEGRLGHVDQTAAGFVYTQVPNAPAPVWEMNRAMGEDDRGVLWVASIGGLARVHEGQVVRAAALGDAVPSARSIHRDDGGTLWFGTTGGLLRRQQGRFRLFGAAEGLWSEQLWQVLTDEVGFIWLASTRGLFRVSIEQLDDVDRGLRRQATATWFDTSDRRQDLGVTIVRQPSAWRGRDGRLWFASDHGLVVVDPKRPHINEQPPSVVIERALVDQRVAHVGGDNRFPPGPGNMEFRFTAVTLIEPRKAELRYRLEGFDRDWLPAGGRRVAQYTNIPPGRYRFRVIGANADGVWNDVGAAVAFRIAPHFYRTPWFFVLCGAALVALAAGLYRARLGRLRRDYLAAFAERSRVARELHDTLLQSMAAVGMHLVGLRRRLRSSDQTTARSLEQIENMVTASLEETRRFVWDLREQSLGKGDLGVALKRLAERITADQPVACQVDVVGQPAPVPNTVQGELFRIAQEAMTNAIKHAGATGIAVRLEHRPDGLELSIADDGKGFDLEQAQGAAEGHFGLVGMRERAERIGRLQVHSQAGAGTTIRVTVELPGNAG
jgi:signal transduction histidine kinase/ligand-binding sensor domain-containing protein